MADDALTLARDLEQRDGAVAARLVVVTSLSEAVAEFRTRVGELQEARAALPTERERLAERRGAVDAELRRAEAELEGAEARLSGLERSPRGRQDELERAAKEAATAREALADARTSVDRVAEALAALDDSERRRRREETELAELAAALFGEIEAAERVAASATQPPGSGLDALEGWASRSRAALFVARGTLETERERIVLEANLLGTSVLGEPLGASSVALVRRRLEAHASP